MDEQEMFEAALDWAREQGRKEAQNHEQVQQVVIDKLEASHKQVTDERDLTTQLDEARKELDEAQARVQELEQGGEHPTLAIQRANHQCELSQYIRQNEQLRRRLDAAKDARIEAEREAADLRAWRKGLVKPGTEEPKRGNVVVVRKLSDYVCLDRYPLSGDIVGWFYPEDIFEAADREE